MSYSSSSTQAGGGGQFTTANGQIHDPSGNVFTAKGVALSDSQMGEANQLLSEYPGLNFVRLAVYSYQSPQAYASFIQNMTSHGVVVELEDHTNSTGGDSGGGQGGAYTGSQLSNELNWYSQVAGAYKSNPDVWFGTDNEPPTNGLSQWEQQTYNAIRDAGNNNPILMELPGGGTPGQTVNDYGMDPSVYSSMSNIIMDAHFYGWASGYSTNQSTVNNALNSLVQGAQSFTSANGTPPVMVGEYGISTDGQSVDQNASQVLQAVQQSNQISGSSAWEFTDGAADTLSDGNGNLNWYGQEVQKWMNSVSNNNASASSTPASTSSSTGGNNSASAVSTSGNTNTATTSNTISFDHSNAWQTPLSGNTMFFINGSNNTIDLSGGSSTVTDNGGSNSFVLPAASTGSATFNNDVLGLGDTINLQVALKATDWDGSASDLSQYVSVNDTQNGATISVAQTAGGSSTQIATIPGETGLDLNGLLAHAII